MNLETRILIDYQKSLKKIEHLKHKRYLYDKIKGITDFYVGIAGIRGIGKTTLLLQLSKEKKDSIYFSADSVYLKPYSLFEVIEKLINLGYKNIFIDEIHKAKDWATTLKTIYDTNEVNIYFSGSSSINLMNQAIDLSRRAVVFNLKPGSFREFLLINKNINLPKISFREILSREKETQYITTLPYLAEYYERGGLLYPYREGFELSVINSLNKMIKEDLLSVKKMSSEMEDIAYKLVFSIAISFPYELSYSSLSSDLGVSKKTIINLTSKLKEIGLLIPINSCGRYKRLRKDSKLYLPFPFRSIINKHIFSKEPDKGVLREEFFVNHVENLCYLKPKGKKTPDFMINSKTFEIGGKSKSRSQKSDYVVVDSISSFNNYLPLHMFGFLY